MAMGGGMKSQPGLRGRRSYKPMAEINVTPMVDVMLVLLVIFMVTAPLLTVGVPVDLPQTKAKVLTEQEEPLVISLNAEGQIFLQDTETTMELIVPRLLAITQNNPEARIYVRGDKTLPYGRIMELMGTVTSAGFSRVALIAETPVIQAQPKKKSRQPGKSK